MIIKRFELNRNKINKFDFFLLYGKNEGLQNEIIDLHLIKDFDGEIIKYEFGSAEPHDGNAMSKEFFDYFESNPPVKDLKVLDYPTKDEEKCVLEFYKKHIMDRKDQKTDTVIISN